MFKSLILHPFTRTAGQLIRAAGITCALILGVSVVTTVSVDLGPALKARAESEGTRFMERPMHIGRLSVHLWRGRFVVEDLLVEGLTPQSRPFLMARRIDVSMPWSSLFNRRVVFDAIEMSDWQMHVEIRDGQHSFPRVAPDGPRGQSAWTTTLEYVRASRGEFTFEDHGTPWSTVARNLDVIVTRPTSEYRGQAEFSNGTVTIQDFVPMRADMSTTFRIVDGKIVLTRIDLETDGTESVLSGEVDIGNWPEQTYQVNSRMQLARMREIFFADDEFSLSGEADFSGTFHLFGEVVNGRSRTGRELKGTLSSARAGVDDYRFDDFRGSVLWVPEDAGCDWRHGDSIWRRRAIRLSHGPAGGWQGCRESPRSTPRTTTLTWACTQIFCNSKVCGFRAVPPVENLLEWPLGRFRERRGSGDVVVAPPPGVAVMSRRSPSSDGSRYSAPSVPSAQRGADDASGRVAIGRRAHVRVRSRLGRVRFQSIGYGRHLCRVQWSDGLRRSVSLSVSCVERELAGERPVARWHHAGSWQPDERDRGWRRRHVRWRDAEQFQTAPDRRAVHRRSPAGLRHSMGFGCRDGDD